MKTVRIVFSSLFGIILFALIFGYSILFVTKSFLVNNVLTESVRATLKENMKDEAGQKKLVDDMFEDGEAKDIIYMIIDNYSKYHKDGSSYKVTKEDADKLYNFVNKYRKENIKIYDRETSGMTEEEFKEYFSYDKINEFARDSFSTLDKELDIEDVDKLLKAYDIATSNPIRILFILIILVFVAGIILINKPMISGLIPIGIDFIISGVLMSVVYIGGEVMAESLVNELLKKDYQISFGSYLVCGITEIVFGIVLIIGTVILKNKFFNKKEVEIKE
ncbi:MAG: hypothetical protein IKH36_03170 [Bacilli bacterium]|nr:hypothetical protein [Bacilli bacterium]